MGLFRSQKKIPNESMNRFLPPEEFPVNCPAVVGHMREAIKKHSGTQWPLFVFFDVEVTRDLPKYMPWDRWSPSHVEDHELEDYPHIMRFAWIFCDERRHVYMARDLIIKPENFSFPPDAAEHHGISLLMALERGAAMKDALQEFCNCLAPATRIIAFDGGLHGVTLEIEMRRHQVPFHVNRQFFYDIREKTKSWCAIPKHEEDEYDPYRHPDLMELYEKLFHAMESERHDAAADVQILEKCFFQLKKKDLL